MVQADVCVSINSIDLRLRADSSRHHTLRTAAAWRAVVCMDGLISEACRDCSEQQNPCLQMSRQPYLEVWRSAACFDYGLPAFGQRRHHRSHCHLHPTSQGRTAGQLSLVNVQGHRARTVHTMTSGLDVPTAASPAVFNSENMRCYGCLAVNALTSWLSITLRLHGRLQSLLQIPLIFVHVPNLQHSLHRQHQQVFTPQQQTPPNLVTVRWSRPDSL